jgi:hypothetical protein
MQEEVQVKVGGAAGGLAAIFRGVGWLLFAILTGRSFSTVRIGRGLKLVVGSVVVAAVIGAVIGAYEVPYPRPPYGFRSDPLAYFDGNGISSSLVGAFVGLALGFSLLFLEDHSAATKIKAGICAALKKVLS